MKPTYENTKNTNGFWIYLLQNKYCEGVYKIGKTTNIKRRLDELNPTHEISITPKKLWWFVPGTSNGQEVMDRAEKLLHQEFAANRIRTRAKGSKREYFKLSPEEVDVIDYHLSQMGFREIQKFEELNN